ncbi:endoplasmic reticulum-Golgi intermediate compartment protein 2-like isoform X1 [Mya arenaria]|uniref:endoplasmic reticulum-Golgi intermediate compartment protein 2-like isoform X1 n=1 Tax=Mya arenaria TaxID=6604 RepID=UPI0022DEE3A9|nr:endoplasmic reticulum-Golgi intermediate compartment protein 2-like isoform X1 [Mya arenaria]XP_052797940.1 endoplasmic reticulum-Golgi intermediate compartment protein 2-like isoform X1 [Mya arenaria]
MRRAAVANRSQASKALKVVKELDAFPKVPDNFKETTASGGGFSLVTFLVIGILIFSEILYYTNTSLKFDYQVDTEVEGKIKINIDMTIAMKCQNIGADVLDQTGQDTHSFGSLNMDPTHYALSPKQQSYRDLTRRVNEYLKDEYHAIQELLWLSGHSPGIQIGRTASKEEPREGPPDACRVHGTLEVNKVAGNFHITAGKHFPQLAGLGHIHLESFLADHDYNFTHRIDHFSFGEMTGGILNPLDGEELVTHSNYHLYQYFMKIVPTKVRTYTNNVDTYQYSVTERNRAIDHSSGSHGVPGIFVKYDLFPFKIVVTEGHLPYSQFLVRLCGIVGGIFVVSGLLHGGVGVLVDVFCCRLKLGRYAPGFQSQPLLTPETDHTPSTTSLVGDMADQAYNPVHLTELNSYIHNGDKNHTDSNNVPYGGGDR